jgi:hypothetical protein
MNPGGPLLEKVEKDAYKIGCAGDYSPSKSISPRASRWAMV